jgi:hypothetical protein
MEMVLTCIKKKNHTGNNNFGKPRIWGETKISAIALVRGRQNRHGNVRKLEE